MTASLSHNRIVATILLDGDENFRGNVRIFSESANHGFVMVGVELPNGSMEMLDHSPIHSVESAKDVINAYWGRSSVWDLQWV